ncbi:MAG: hypothetical protein ACE15F_00285 [bacterium]
MIPWTSRSFIAALLPLPLFLALSGCASGPRREQPAAVSGEAIAQPVPEPAGTKEITPSLDDLRGYLLPARPRTPR